MKCPNCPMDPAIPCPGEPGTYYGESASLPVLCRWAASDDPVLVAHVIARTRIAVERRPPRFFAEILTDREMIAARRAGKQKLDLGQRPHH